MTPHGRMNIPINRVQYVAPRGYKRARLQLRSIFYTAACVFLTIVALASFQIWPMLLAKLVSPNW